MLLYVLCFFGGFVVGAVAVWLDIREEKKGA
jgi:hypothetical protein